MSIKSSHKVFIIGENHRHKYEYGFIGLRAKGSDTPTASIIMRNGVRLLEVWLENCTHGNITTYVSQDDMDWLGN